ncbi:nucleotidyltransferase family protein [Thiomicrorhabdus heinhorstiae]|uniref:Nucleotidyltransferase family protein n=1 Tax=Thiomicrorhabdus heinhorstiae TaxID=2748010 RepID=A0ABS0C090_9GAMM|nr:nucleotidyltransferase family protein [Thiomicrorhabdus heinhorstiae]MBF6058664.1 nucleotidyltransferase family protein [Thiomicrorhabdus heinhorstiae]
MKLYPDFKNITLYEDASIRDAMALLDRYAMQIVLVTNEEGVLKGVITDGDIRRALLAGCTLASSVREAMNSSPKTGSSHMNLAGWRQVMKSAQCRHLPVIDDEGKLVELVYDKNTPIVRQTSSVVLMLGGLGTRLRPLTEDTPKPLLEIGGKPILETILERFSEQGFNHFYFCINYLGDQIKDYFGNGENWGVHIEYIREEQRLGTAGALSLINRQVDEDLIVMNGDLLTKVDFVSLLKMHRQHSNDVTVCVREYTQQIPYGVVEVDNESVQKIVEKPVYRYFLNAGIYVLTPSLLSMIPYNQFYDMPTLLDELLAKDSGKVGAFPITEYWKDIGHFPDFEQAQVDYELHFTPLK